MDKKFISNKILKMAKKIKCINYLGGKCKKCNEKRIFRLTFHHNGIKKFEIGKSIGKRWSDLKIELQNCDLLCRNCHEELHFLNSNKRNIKNKKLFMDYKNVSGCQNCGYNKCLSSLHFHHLNNKIFKISLIPINCRSLEEIQQHIISELDKCVILCANCHQEEHSDLQFFKKNKLEIFKKLNSMKEKQPKIDREIVHKMYFTDNLKQIEIAKFFNCSKGTISDIIKNL